MVSKPKRRTGVVPPFANTSTCSGTMVLPSMAAWT